MKKIYAAQKSFFAAGKTKDYKFRKENLRLLKEAILANRDRLLAALRADLNKSETEAILTEIWPVLNEINYYLKRLKKWMRPQPVKTGLLLKPGKSYRLFVPRGVNLIISPWNFPVNLTFIPLAAAIAAGNTAIIKVASASRHSAEVMADIIKTAFAPEHVACLVASKTEAAGLLDWEFDHVFFTGSPAAGKVISAKAARYLTPVTLELGGKSPGVIDDTADIISAARRIAFGKTVNAGQTCIAPDYLILKKEVATPFLAELKTAFAALYPGGYLNNENYPKIINEKQYNRLLNLLTAEKPLFGGSARNQKIEPTVILADAGNSLMKEEIFGPILPVILYEKNDEIKKIIERHPFPLALYLFSNNKRWRRELIGKVRCGGCSINDTLSHFINNRLPFGGIRHSGHGSYHGFYSFRTFSHETAVYEKHPRWELKLKYPPYSKITQKLIKRFFLTKK